MNKGIGLFLLNIAVALYLAATGILGLTGRKFFPNGEIRQAVTALFRGDFAEVLIIIISVLAVAAGAAILLRFFGVDFPMSEMIMLILAIVWVVFIILVDAYFPIKKGGVNFVDWLRNLGSHLMVLSGILLSTERFGG